MISVLIATYNYDAFPLVEKLHLQLEKAQISFEIICIDDASNSKLNIKNKQINFLENCSFETLSKNIGRSAIRNLLAKKAIFDWLLFLDADVFPTSEDFIQKYIGETEKNLTNVFLGGITYKEGKNSDLLRYKLGKNGEEQSANTRNKNPFNYFFTANFFIKKEVFKTIKFDDNLTKYGYEDLLFAKELELQKISIKHIDNAVFHLGIDVNSVFLNKTKEALKNLIFLINSGRINKEDTKISKTFFKLKKLGFIGFLKLFSNQFEKLADKKSSLFYYHLFRLTYLQKIFKNLK